jgi:hypothetical protein
MGEANMFRTTNTEMTLTALIAVCLLIAAILTVLS